jgi:hypothetical protein
LTGSAAARRGAKLAPIRHHCGLAAEQLRPWPYALGPDTPSSSSAPASWAPASPGRGAGRPRRCAFRHARRRARRARAKLAATLDGLAAKGKLDGAEAKAIAGRIAPRRGSTTRAGCGLVVEAIVENADAKRALFRDLEAIVGATACSRRTPRRSRSPRSPTG